MIDRIIRGYNVSGYPGFEGVAISLYHRSDLYIWVVTYGLWYRRSRFFPITSSGKFRTATASFGYKKEMVAVFGISALGFVISNVDPDLDGVLAPESTGVHLYRVFFASDAQSDIEIIIIPAKVDLSKWPTTP